MSGHLDSCPHCGVVLEQPKTKARSSPQHRRFFALCAAAFASWPEGHNQFRPKNAEHLRHWLTMRAGKFTIKQTARIESTDPDKLYALFCAFLRHSDDDNLFLDLDGNLLVEMKADSISYDNMDQAAFNELSNTVAEIVEAEIGVSAEKLLRENERAA